MTTLCVQYSDTTEAVIVSYFGSPQDPSVYPGYGTVETSDARWKTFYDSEPFMQSGLPAPTEIT
jgi:hypothetical protein